MQIYLRLNVKIHAKHFAQQKLNFQHIISIINHIVLLVEHKTRVFVIVKSDSFKYIEMYVNYVYEHSFLTKIDMEAELELGICIGDLNE
jgi:hypothetical protein